MARAWTQITQSNQYTSDKKKLIMLGWSFGILLSTAIFTISSKHSLTTNYYNHLCTADPSTKHALLLRPSSEEFISFITSDNPPIVSKSLALSIWCTWYSSSSKAYSFSARLELELFRVSKCFMIISISFLRKRSTPSNSFRISSIDLNFLPGK